MREARIVAPLLANGPEPRQSLEASNRRLVDALTLQFGGVTITQGQGRWTDNGVIYIDPVNVYDVAMWPEPRGDLALVKLARTFMVEAGQEALYLRYADGTVVILDKDLTEGDE